ncbi:hypothetical protein ACPCGZ_02545 [Propionibacteriaceae bacterium G1746]
MTILLSRSALIDQGYDSREIRRQVSAGQLVRVQRGYYTMATPVEQERWRLERQVHLHRIHACVAGAEHPVVVSHASAAVVHDLPAPRAALSKVHLVQERDGGWQRQGVRKTTGRIDPVDIVQVGALIVTSVARTVIDLGRSVHFGWAVAAVDHALREQLCTLDDLHDCLARCSGLPGIVSARRAVLFGDPRAESVGESRSRALLWSAGLAPDELQREFPHSRGTDRVDMWWTGGLIGEFDGRGKYLANFRPGDDPGEAVWQEKVREDRLRRQGNALVRWTWDEVERQPDDVVSRVRTALAGVRRRLF